MNNMVIIIISIILIILLILLCGLTYEQIAIKKGGKVIQGKLISSKYIFGTPPQWLIKVEYSVDDQIQTKSLIVTDRSIEAYEKDAPINLIYVRKLNKVYWVDGNKNGLTFPYILISAAFSFLVVALLLLLFVAQDNKNLMEGMNEMKYTFRTATEKDTIDLSGMSKICDIYDFFIYSNQISEKHSLALGQLMTRFGEPLYISENLEAQYEYHIIGTDENGKKYLFLVYSGPTGPSVGGKSGDKSACDAAEALAEYIRDADATDYTYEGYYMDGPCKVWMGVKDGNAYFKEEELNLSEEEFTALYKRLYGLEE